MESLNDEERYQFEIIPAELFSHSSTCKWRRKWQPSSVLAWRIPGTEEPGGLLSMGSHRVRHD